MQAFALTIPDFTLGLDYRLSPESTQAQASTAAPGLQLGLPLLPLPSWELLGGNPWEVPALGSSGVGWALGPQPPQGPGRGRADVSSSTTITDPHMTTRAPLSRTDAAALRLCRPRLPGLGAPERQAVDLTSLAALGHASDSPASVGTLQVLPASAAATWQPGLQLPESPGPSPCSQQQPQPTARAEQAAQQQAQHADQPERAAQRPLAPASTAEQAQGSRQPQEPQQRRADAESPQDPSAAVGAAGLSNQPPAQGELECQPGPACPTEPTTAEDSHQPSSPKRPRLCHSPLTSQPEPAGVTEALDDPDDWQPQPIPGWQPPWEQEGEDAPLPAAPGPLQRKRAPPELYRAAMKRLVRPRQPLQRKLSAQPAADQPPGPEAEAAPEAALQQAPATQPEQPQPAPAAVSWQAPTSPSWAAEAAEDGPGQVESAAQPEASRHPQPEAGSPIAAQDEPGTVVAPVPAQLPVRQQPANPWPQPEAQPAVGPAMSYGVARCRPFVRQPVPAAPTAPAAPAAPAAQPGAEPHRECNVSRAAPRAVLRSLGRFRDQAQGGSLTRTKIAHPPRGYNSLTEGQTTRRGGRVRSLSSLSDEQWLSMKERAAKLRLGQAGRKGLGLFALDPIPAGSFVCEYTGEVVRCSLEDLREGRWQAQGLGDYLFRRDAETVIDATKKGGQARYINHSCAGNCESYTVQSSTGTRIVIAALVDIKPDTELTYDYRFAPEPDKAAVPCLCSAATCRGRMN